MKKAEPVVFSELLMKLEAERNDLSYKQRTTVDDPFQQAVNKRKEIERLTKMEQKLWFDAGRATAGAQDPEAKAALRAIKKIAKQQ